MARTGRPRGFDKEAAIEAAMLLFWRQGFGATTVADLKTAMGDLSPTSFYAAFGSKDDLCDAVLERYLATHGQVGAPLHDETLSPRQAIERTLRGTARMQTDPAHPLGCLIVLSGVNGPAPGTPVAAALAAERERNAAGILACVRRAVAAGELDQNTDVAGLATLIHGFLCGISLRARDGESADAIQRGIDALLKAWDACRPMSERRRGRKDRLA